MTQPIQEPGQTTRTDAKLTWGQNQLYRRPAPVSDSVVHSLQAISLASLHPDPVEYPSGDLKELTWGHWAISDSDIFDADTLIDGELYIFSGLIPGNYEVKATAAFAFDNGGPLGVTFRFVPTGLGGFYAPGDGALWLYDDELGHYAGADLGYAYIFQTTVDVPPFDPEDTVIVSADPPTGFSAFIEVQVNNPSGAGWLKETRLQVYYRGPLAPLVQES